MRNAGRGAVWKLWCFAAGVIGLGAWISPLLFNAGKALAEISQGKTTNGFLEWLGRVCGKADFPEFQRAALGLALILGVIPWIKAWWTRRGEQAGSLGVWQLLWRNPQGLRQSTAGFLLVAGSMMAVAGMMVFMGWLLPWAPRPGIALWALASLVGSCLAALLMEVMFRGVALGIFLRGKSPWGAIVMSAVFFAAVLHFVPDGSVNVPDPEADGMGFELIRLMAVRLLDWRVLVCDFIPVTLLGVGLAFLRWRTASLWMAVGAHAGWRFGKSMIATVSIPSSEIVVISPNCLQHTLIPVLALFLTSALVRRFLHFPNS